MPARKAVQFYSATKLAVTAIVEGDKVKLSSDIKLYITVLIAKLDIFIVRRQKTCIEESNKGYDNLVYNVRYLD